MASRTDLTIHLRRSRTANEETDDVIRVHRGTMFEALYWDGETKRTCRNVFSRTEMLSYFSILLNALVIDMIPFDSIQIMINGFPSIVYSIADIESGTTGWNTAITTLRWFVDGQWVTQPQAPYPGGRYLGTALQEMSDTSSLIPEFVPTTARVSLAPQSSLRNNFGLVAEENPLDESN
jgi:hypothetical protein